MSTEHHHQSEIKPASSKLSGGRRFMRLFKSKQRDPSNPSSSNHHDKDGGSRGSGGGLVSNSDSIKQINSNQMSSSTNQGGSSKEKGGGGGIPSSSSSSSKHTTDKDEKRRRTRRTSSGSNRIRASSADRLMATRSSSGSSHKSGSRYHHHHHHSTRRHHGGRITQEMIAKRWKLERVPQYRCDEKGYIHFEKGLLIHDQFVLLETLGRGTFSKVFEAVDVNDGRKYALKVIRNSHRYIEAAKTERRVLEHITDTCDGRSCCIHLREHFHWNNHPCFVFKLYGNSIYAVMSKNHYRPFPDYIVRDLSSQICTAIQFLHHLGIIFTDLKPENIVFVDGRTKQVVINGKTNHLPINTRVKIVDFGSAVYEPRYDPGNRATWKFRHGYNYLIQTRHYRAPEVVLEMHWKRRVDIWSIACVILEFLYGSMVFNTHCPIDHLSQMQKMIGVIPRELIESASDRKFSELFHRDSLTLRLENAKRSRAQAKPLHAYFDLKRPEHIDLYDLCKRMLQWRAEDRITVDDIMRHRYWITSDPMNKARLHGSEKNNGNPSLSSSSSSSSSSSTLPKGTGNPGGIGVSSSRSSRSGAGGGIKPVSGASIAGSSTQGNVPSSHSRRGVME